MFHCYVAAKCSRQLKVRYDNYAFKGDSFYSIGRKTRKQLGFNIKQEATGAGVASRAVPAIDGTNCYSWGEAKEKVKQKCLGMKIMNDWRLDPVVIQNQNLFRMEPVFCEKIASMQTKLRFIMNVRKNFLVGDNLYRQIRSHDE